MRKLALVSFFIFTLLLTGCESYPHHPVTQTAVPFYALNAANKKSAPNVTQNLTFERIRCARSERNGGQPWEPGDLQRERQAVHRRAGGVGRLGGGVCSGDVRSTTWHGVDGIRVAVNVSAEC
jgi:hypothetical protein